MAHVWQYLDDDTHSCILHDQGKRREKERAYQWHDQTRRCDDTDARLLMRYADIRDRGTRANQIRTARNARNDSARY